MRFWFHGTGGGDAIRFQLHDNRAPDAGPILALVWSDEFNGPAGRRLSSRNWTHEIGDGTANGIPGWGTTSSSTTPTTRRTPRSTAGPSPSRRQSDGSLSLLRTVSIHLRAVGSQYKAEFAYGRIETRIKVRRAPASARVLEPGHQHR